MSEAEVTKTVKKVSGVVASAGMDKSIVVRVSRRIKHPRYKKYITRSTKLLVHDEQNECKVGDTVCIEESRPLSKRKAWVLVQIEEKSA